MRSKQKSLEKTKQAAPVLSRAMIEGLATLDANEAAAALTALYRNPHVAMIAGAQADYCMSGTREPLSDQLWQSISGDMKDAWASDWWNTSANEAIWQLKADHGICEVEDCNDAENCSNCILNDGEAGGQAKEDKR